MVENLSETGLEMIRFEHETLVKLVSYLKGKLDTSIDLKPFEREMYQKRIELLLTVCEANREMMKLQISIEKQKTARLN